MGLAKLMSLTELPADTRFALSFEEAGALHKEGNAHFALGEWREAGAKYLAGLELIGAKHDCPPACRQAQSELNVLCAGNLAACALNLGDFDEAFRRSNEVLALNPSNSKARFRRCTALVRGAVSESGKSQGEPNISRRAAALLEAQADLDQLCREKPSDKAISSLVEELFARSRVEGVRLRPQASSFPKEMRRFDYQHELPASEVASTSLGCSGGENLKGGPGRERNLLIILHGFGGRRDSFSALASALRLPRTASLTLDGPLQFPDDLLDDPPGFSWHDVLDESFDFIRPTAQECRRLSSIEVSCALMVELIQIALVDACGWRPSEIFLFGYGQGGSLALDMLVSRHSVARCLGGILGVATELLPERRWRVERAGLPVGTPGDAEGAPAVLLIHGEEDETTLVASAEESAELLRQASWMGPVQLEIFKGRRSEMLRGGHPEETRCVMQWFSDHLHGVGRKGSQEAMRKLGAEEVQALERVDVDEAPADFLALMD